jgi:hypothetical protein
MSIAPTASVHTYDQPQRGSTGLLQPYATAFRADYRILISPSGGGCPAGTPHHGLVASR